MAKIYLDNAAATPIDPRVASEIRKADKLFANPSSYNNSGRAARKALESARLMIARFISAHADEIILTSSASESNNLAVKGISGLRRGNIVTTPIEHPSVLAPIKFLNKTHEAKYVKIDPQGGVNLKDLESKINKETILVSIMYANNEIGTIEPIIQIGKIIKKFKNKNNGWPLFHVDACQAAGFLNMSVNALGVDLLTFNSTKIYGPKGAAILYVRRGLILDPIIHGGEQERGHRAGTENLSAIIGFAKAVSVVSKKEAGKIKKLRDYFIAGIKKSLPEIRINGPEGNKRLPNNVHVSIPHLTSEQILIELDKYGISAGSGSACTAHSVAPSHVLAAINTPKEYLDGAVRFSLSRYTTKKDIDYTIKSLIKVVTDLRKRYNLV